MSTLNKKTTHALQQCCRYTHIARIVPLTDLQKIYFIWNFTALMSGLGPIETTAWHLSDQLLSMGNFAGLYRRFEKMRVKFGVDFPDDYNKF